MKPLNCLILCLTTLAFTPAFGQQTAPGATTFSQRIQAATKAAEATEGTKLTKFDLDFPGGTPKQLVVAIEKATKRPLNAVIPDESANEPIPPLKMSEITVADLFRAIESASVKNVAYPTGSYYGAGGTKPTFSYQQMRTSIGFQTDDKPPSDNSIWYFHGREKVPDIAKWSADPPAARVCRYYSLSPYLERGTTVDDITTAIQTGWKMLGEKELPTINYHKDTKLLIAVGEPDKLSTIDLVLIALHSSGYKPINHPTPVSSSATPKPAEKSKTEN